MNITDDMGWDDIAESYGATYGKDKLTTLYWSAYDYCEDGDPDSGICFAMREYAIDKMVKKATEICQNLLTP